VVQTIAQMFVPVSNMIDQVDLTTEDAFLPLLECIVNSIVSLNKSDLPKSKRKIQITLERGNAPAVLNFDGQNIIGGFKVVDNGIGFTDENLKSFETPYTKYNKKYGCKGVGRFTVLAAYESYEISSVYKKDNKYWLRELSFSNSEEEIKTFTNKEIENKDLKTVITVSSPRNIPWLHDATARSLEDIVDIIVEHLLIYFLSKELPVIEIIDGDRGENINERYEKIAKDKEKEFEVKGEKFKLFVTKTPKQGNRRVNYLHYCANSRTVGAGRNLKTVNGLFANSLPINGIHYLVNVYLVSDYLDKCVNTHRNGFKIPRVGSDFFIVEDTVLSFEDIESKISDILIDLYSDLAQKAQEKSMVDTLNYIKENPRYRSLSRKPELLRSIPLNVSEDKRDELLHKLIYKARQSVDRSVKKFIDNHQVNEEAIKKIMSDLKEKTAFDVDSLADYMSRRKAVIQLFQKFLDADENGSYKLEEDLHNLIFPMGYSGDFFDDEGHNLWLLDERFLTYKFVASDKKITSFSQIKSNIEPDLVLADDENPVFDNPIGFGDKSSGELSSLVIFEFKRPGETAYQKRKNDYRWQFSELIEKYFDDFLYSPMKKNYKGNQVTVTETTPKFGYIIVDQIPKPLAEYNHGRGWKKTPFGTWFKIEPELNLNMEVLTFRQLLNFSQQRHQGFFDKLFGA